MKLMKLMLLMMLQMVNLKTKIVGEMPKRLPQPGNPGDVDGPAQHR